MRQPLIIALIGVLSSRLDALAGSEAGGHPPIPDWVIIGIAAVETGSTYRDGHLIHYRDRRDGADGEVGPWQLAPTALSDLGITHLRSRIRTEPVLAESMARAWLLRCYRIAGDWTSAVAIYHTGPRGDRQRGSRYAERVFAAGGGR